MTLNSNNSIMHDILGDLSHVIELLDRLSDDKAFKQGEWTDFIVRSAAQAQQLHRKTCLWLWESSSMEDDGEEIF